MNLTEVCFATQVLDDMKTFYADELRLPLLEQTAKSITLEAGTTKLVFVQAAEGTTPFYHFAFDVPHNKLSEAKAWLSERVSLLEDEGEDEFEQPTGWNARAVYLLDPADNVVELIARRNLPNATHRPFSVRDVLYVSEVGVPVKDVEVTVEELRHSLGLEVWNNQVSAQFAAVGDEQGLFIVVREGRIWFPIVEPARAYPIAVVAEGDREGSHVVAELGYDFRVLPTPRHSPARAN
jgi:catechol-2,3-dioxygenase